MIQAPFGSTTPAWPGLPSPLAWSQPPVSIASSEPMSPTGFGWGGRPRHGDPLHGDPCWAAHPCSPEHCVRLTIPEGVTAPVLMTAVAFRRGLPQGPNNDHDVEELLYDALELIPSAGDVEVRCESGRVTLSGNVPHKRIKHDVGELAWAIPVINDVQNTVTITGRRRSRAFGREAEPQGGTQARKQS